MTISRVEYEAMQARLSGLEEQLRSKTEELAETLLKNQWLLENLKLTKKKLFGESSEQLDQMVIEKFGHLFNEAEGWDASSYEKETKVKSHILNATRAAFTGVGFYLGLLCIEDVAAASLRYAARAAS